MPVKDDLKKLNSFIENSVVSLEESIAGVQDDAVKFIKELIFEATIENGRFAGVGNLSKMLVEIDKRLKRDVKKIDIKDYLSDLNDISKRTIDIHKSYNDLKKDIKALSEARQIIYQQAQTAFNIDSIALNYIQPIKNLVARQVLTNATIKETINLIEKWGKGDLSSGRLNKGNPAPNIERYAVQMARDTAHSMNRTTNDIIRRELNLDSFIYVGGLVADSRPLCVALVRMNRDIKLSEIPALVDRYPDGLYPNTTRDNFLQVCGGYSCRHTAFAVRSKE